MRRFICFSPSVLVCVLSHVRLFETPWTVALQVPLSMGFSRQECWSGLSFPPPGDLLNPGIEPVSPVFPTLAGEFLTTEPLGRLYTGCYIFQETLQSVLDLSLSDVNLEGPGM